ncbi:MAG: hypothetical protein K2I56_00985 [Muribaculaceae bacterium]|nr:hypothetical protein [Muribaculaceae bacterium]
MIVTAAFLIAKALGAAWGWGWLAATAAADIVALAARASMTVDTRGSVRTPDDWES